MRRRRTASAQAAAAAPRRSTTPEAAAAPPASGLSVCVACHKDFVVPVRWEPVGTDRWWMFVRCAECGVSREVTVSNDVADRYDAELAVGTRAIRILAGRLESERIEDEVVAFATAMRDGRIEPADFAR